MKNLIIAAMLAGFSAQVHAQEVSELVGTLQANGYISIAQIREMRSKQFDTLDKDKSGGLSQEEAQGALSLSGRRGGPGAGAGAGAGGPGAGGRAAGMTEEQRKALRERIQQRRGGGGQGGQGGMGGGRRGQSGGAGGPGSGAGGPGGGFGQMQFMAADGDFDGQLTRAEFVEAPIPTMVGADKDMDGRITVEEIQAIQMQQRGSMEQMADGMMPQ